MCVTHSAIQNSKLGPGESRNSKRGPPGYAQLFCFYPPYSSRVRGAAEAQARRGTRGVKRIKTKVQWTFVPLNGLATDGEPRACKQEHGERSAASRASGPGTAMALARTV